MEVTRERRGRVDMLTADPSINGYRKYRKYMGHRQRPGREDRQSGEATDQKSLQAVWKEGQTIPT